jgi:DNA topoisomerase-1
LPGQRIQETAVPARKKQTPDATEPPATTRKKTAAAAQEPQVETNPPAQAKPKAPPKAKAPAKEKAATKAPAKSKTPAKAKGQTEAVTDAAVKKTTSRKKTATPEEEPPRKSRPIGGGGGGYDLVIVESPSKAKTINKYLGSRYRVLASYGHVRDLPRRRKKGEVVAGVNIEAGWVPTYVIVEREDGKSAGRRTAKDILAELRKEAIKADKIFLATDPDREGEAIAWHIEQALNLNESFTYRVAFNEITRKAVNDALANPGKINMDRVTAQEARRMLDRVVGYPLSNLLGKKIALGSSAGRVQSVALRLVVDREREIEAFKPEEYWRLIALLAPKGLTDIRPKKLSILRTEKPAKGEAEGDAEAEAKPKKKAKEPEIPEGSYVAELKEYNKAPWDPKNETDALEVAASMDDARYVVTKIEQNDRQDRPPPPFTTSTLQMTAHARLHFTAQRTMQTAQRLYEGVQLGSEGSVALITYMRTDSTRVSDDALRAVRGFIDNEFGQTYLPNKANFFASGKSAQEAHEAIRPTDVGYTPERAEQLGLSGDQLRLYTLIWQRFVASQMVPAVFAVTTVEILATPKDETPEGLFKASGRVLKFDGYRPVLAHVGKQDEAEIPPLKQGQEQDRLELTASQHFTKPPPRYNEGSLVKALEKEGIGRPSTYATIIAKITSKERGYVEVRERRFYATDIGKAATDLLVEHFPKVMDLKFTSQMEEELDDIETTKREQRKVLDDFWGPFSVALKEAEEKMPTKRGRETGEMCPKCGSPLVANFSKKTKREFIGCSGYKVKGCRYIKPGEGEEANEPILTEFECPNCGKPLERRKGQWGEYFSCSGRPECKTNLKIDAEGKPQQTAKPTEYTCDKCDKPMVLREGRRGPFLACTGYPKCKNAKDVDANGKPIEVEDLGLKCEKCNAAMAIRKGPRGPFLGCTAYPKCRNYKALTAELREKLKLPDPPAKKEAPKVQINETCPECGAAMKARQGRKGWFLGCSKYPKCKGTKEASAELAEQLAEAEVSS